jgi:hypothetical protein
MDLRRRFYVKEVRFDPYQLVSTSQRVVQQGLPMVEFPQTTANLTEASSNLYELVKGRNLLVYEDAEMRLAVGRAVAVESSRGWRISKEKASHKIDVVVALAQAALGAVQQGQAQVEYSYTSAPPRAALDYGHTRSSFTPRRCPHGAGGIGECGQCTAEYEDRYAVAAKSGRGRRLLFGSGACW